MECIEKNLIITYCTVNLTAVSRKGEPGGEGGGGGGGERESMYKTYQLSVYLASSPGPFPAFQCCTLKSRRAWEAKSRE